MDNQSRGEEPRADSISVFIRYGARVGKTLIFVLLLWVLIAFGLNGIGGAHKAASRVLALITGTDDPLGAEREQGTPTKKVPAYPSIDTMATGTTANQMAVQWSYFATGTPSSAGFYLVSGSGETGDSCDAGDGRHLLKFGTHQMGMDIPDFISALSTTDNTGVVGAFWFNSRNNTIRTYNTTMMKNVKGQSKSIEGVDLNDGILEIRRHIPGVVLIGDVRYHACHL